MRVIPYYCARCGVRIQAADARFGRSKTDARTYYCPACVMDLDIDVADSGGVALESDSDASGRAGTIQSAFDLPRSKRLSLRRGQSSSGSLRRPPRAPAPRTAAPSRTLWFVLLAGALVLAGLITGRAWHSETASSPAQSPATQAGLPPEADPTGETAAVGPASDTRRTADAEQAAGAGKTADSSQAADAATPSASHAPAGAAYAPPPTGPAAAPPPTHRAAGTQGPYVLNRRTGTLHLRGCRWERKMSEENRLPFPNLEAVRASGLRFKRCRTCLGDH